MAPVDEVTQLTKQLWSTIASGQAPGLQGVDLVTLQATLGQYVAAAAHAWDTLTHDAMLGLPGLDVKPLDLFLQNADEHPLSAADRQTILDQAELLFSLYPHLPFKREDFTGVRPVSLLNDIRPQLGKLGETDFHLAVQLAFANVHDVHTSYVMPASYQGSVAFLPFQVRFYEEIGTKRKRYIVTKIMDTGIPNVFLDFQPGVEIVSWNGEPTADEVQRASALHPGATPASAELRGTVALTARPIATLGLLVSGEPPFRKDAFAVVEYLDGNSTPRKIVFPWAVGTGFDVNQIFSGSAGSVSLSQRECQLANDVLWSRDRIYQAGKVIAARGERRARPGTHSQPVWAKAEEGSPATDTSQASVLPTVFQFQFPGGTPQTGLTSPAALSWGEKKCGYIRIASFGADLTALDVTRTLLDEFERILLIMNQQAPDGLILDIRSNPGGDIAAAERMLQMLTPDAILPERFQLANTPAVRAFLKLVASGLAEGGSELPADTLSEFQPWAADATIKPPPEGPRLTSGQHLTNPDDANDTGQIYQGPVVLLTDALTYSAADIFAGGFQDNEVGKIIGSDPTTGGGGANVWNHADLLAARIVPLRPLPAGSSMGLALRRSARVGKAEGKPIEDFGVNPDLLSPRTLKDIFDTDSPSFDLMQFACKTLASMPVYRVDVQKPLQITDSVKVTLTATNIASLSFYQDHESTPILTAPAMSGTQQTFVVPFLKGVKPHIFRVKGQDSDGRLRAVTTIRIPSPPRRKLLFTLMRATMPKQAKKPASRVA